MDTVENYYTTLGVPIDADGDTLKRAYRQLARRFHPDLAGPEGAVQMKRINRAYDVLSDPEKRLNYDTIIGGVIDLRTDGVARSRPRPHKFDMADDIEFSGLSIFSTKGPLQKGPVLHTQIGVISALTSTQTAQGISVAAGSLDGKGLLWQVGREGPYTSFAADPTFTVESLRELRLSPAGRLLVGWGRLGLHVWNTQDGTLLWSYPFGERAVSAHYSLDVQLQEMPAAPAVPDGQRNVVMALPLFADDARAPGVRGVRGTDVVTHTLATSRESLSNPLVCVEEELEKRSFWAIRLRGLASHTRTLLTLSCAHVLGEQHEMVVLRRWDLTAHARFKGPLRPQIISSVLLGRCADCGPPYTVTPEASTLAFVSGGNKLIVCETASGLYSELPCGKMGGSSKLVLSPAARFLAVAREDSEINEGVIDLWSVSEGRLVQKLYHPWQISALHFAQNQLLVALTDGTIQLWQ